mgnify:CR=1 FL=1
MWALDEAEDMLNDPNQQMPEDEFLGMYRMAPIIAAIVRSVPDSSRDEVCEYSIGLCHYLFQEMPHYKLKYRRCFVHAYLDSMIFLKYINKKKSECIIDYLDSKSIIEAC